MKRCIRTFFLLIYGVLAAGVLRAQDTAIRTNSRAGILPLAAGPVQEKLFLHPDKTTYLTGETCWFSLYCLDASTHQPLGVSRIAYVELLNRSGVPVLQTKVQLDSGFGSGSVPLPPTLATGHYLVRAYTSWMQNFPAAFYYSSDITVINTLHGSAADLPDSFRRPSIAFFPEGGRLIQGIVSRMAIRVRTGSGAALSAAVALRSRNHNLFTTIQTDSNGIGVCEITPRGADSLYAILLADSLHEFGLPAAAATGYTLTVKKDHSGFLSVTVHATVKEENKPVFIATQTRQVLKNLQTANISNAMAAFSIPTDSLGDGVAVITLLDENRQPVAERLYFNPPHRQLNIETSTDAGTYYTRSPIQLSVSSETGTVPIPARLSATLFRLDSLQPMPAENLLSWLMLRSDLPELSAETARYLGRNDEESRGALDNLMLTSGWRRFSGLGSGNHPKSMFHFLPEIEGPVLYARVVNRSTGNPAPNVPYLMAVSGEKWQINTSTSNAKGELLFASLPFAKNDPVILQPGHAADSSYRLEIDHAFSDSATNTPLSSIHLDRAFAMDLKERNLALQVASSFPIPGKQVLPLPSHKDSGYFYGSADRHFHLENYTRYVTMEEVLREFVEDVRVRKEGKQYHFFVRNTLFNTFFGTEPLILLDGVPVTDPTKIIALDPLKISDIDLVTHRFTRGADDFDGIIALRSYSGEAGAANLDPGAVVLDFAGLQERREFHSPDYSDSDMSASSLPDYRTTLWWAADLKTGSSGKLQTTCFTGDLPGNYALLVEGITAGGKAGYSLKTITVTQKK